MSAATSVRDRLSTDEGFRVVGLAGVGVLLASYLSVLYHVTDVVGGSTAMVLVTVAVLGLATVLGRFLRLRSAALLTVVLVVGGFAVYFLTLPQSQLELLSVDRLLADTVALLTGLSVLRLTAADVWALAILPGPTFLAWYLAMRGRYVLSVLAGGTALGLFVLTGDASPVVTLAGVGGAALAVAFGTLDLEGGSVVQVDAITIVMATMLVLAATVSVVPGGAAQPLLPNRGSDTVEASLIDTDDSIEVLGSISLSPSVRFTIESEETHYWQVAAFDRYTGTGWVRTGSSAPYRGRLAGPPGASRSLSQTVTAEGALNVLPAAWRPVEVSDEVSGRVSVTPQGGLRPATTISEGTTYTVQSRVPQFTREQLRRSGEEYPDEIAEAYLQVPDSTSERVRVRAAEIAGGEDNAYDKAVAIEAWLEENKRYSLSVNRPDGNIADQFLFEMDAGYCTYYATTMVTLLRAQDVPARFVVGYTPGERTEDGRHVVRGLDSHAWVQVYFPEVGWVNFDPTPSAPRESAESARVAEARQTGDETVDTEETQPTQTPVTPNVDTNNTTATNETLSDTDIRRSLGADETQTPLSGDVQRQTPTGGPITQGEGGGGFDPQLPSRETMAFGLVALVGAAASVRRLGYTGDRLELLWLWFQRTSDDPDLDVERAYDRLETALAHRYRPRRTGETPRRYLRALGTRGSDPRLTTVGEAYERAHYGRGVTREEADEAVSAVNELVRETLPVVGRLRS